MLANVFFDRQDSTDLKFSTTSSAPPALSRFSGIENEYLLFFEKYKLSLLDLRQSLQSEEGMVFPSVPIKVTPILAGETMFYQIVFDDTLLHQMVALYSCYGWSAINQISVVLGIQEDPVAGVPDRKTILDKLESEYVISFFQGVRQILANIICDCLIYMERQLRSMAIAGLTQASGKIANAFHTLKLEKRGSEKFPHYIFSNSDPLFASNIHVTLESFARRHQQLLEIVEKMSLVSKGLEQDKDRHANLKTELLFNTLLSDMPLPDFDLKAFRESILQAEIVLSKLEESQQSKNKEVESTLSLIKTNFGPAALPALLLIKPNDTQTTTANKLGQYYLSLGKRVDELEKNIPLDSHLVQHHFKRAVGREPDGIANVKFPIPAESLEKALVKFSFSQRSNMSDAIILTDPNMIYRILDSDAVSVDSMEYIVLFQYAITLEQHLVEMDQAAQSSRTDDLILHKASSGFSLLNLLIGGPFLGVTSSILDALMFARFILSTIEQFEILEIESDRALLTNMHESYFALGRAGELIASRKRLANSVSLEATKMLLLIAGSKRFALVHLEMTMHMYYSDVETLFGSSEN